MSEEGQNGFDDLFQKIMVRVYGNGTVEDPDDKSLTAAELEYIVRGMFHDYNVVLNKKVEEDRTALNKKIRRTILTRKYIPYISSIIPTIKENGEQTIVVCFEYDHRCMGIANINKDMSIDFEFLKNGCSRENTVDMLNQNYTNFLIYFAMLDRFASEYPGVACEFGPDGASNNIQTLSDGFIDVKLNVGRDEIGSVMLKNSSDSGLAAIKTGKYGRIEDSVIAYRWDMMCTFKVNEEELNPLYKGMLDKYREQYVEGQGVNRVLRVNQ